MLPEQGQKQPRLLKVQNLNELTLCPIPGTSGGGAVTSRGGFRVLRGSHKPEVLTLSGLQWAPAPGVGTRRCAGKGGGGAAAALGPSAVTGAGAGPAVGAGAPRARAGCLSLG